MGWSLWGDGVWAAEMVRGVDERGMGAAARATRCGTGVMGAKCGAGVTQGRMCGVLAGAGG